jgi:hypothetical protein
MSLRCKLDYLHLFVEDLEITLMPRIRDTSLLIRPFLQG